MTCIVGLVHAGTVIIGGDSAGVEGWNVTVRHDPKVFRNGPYLIGYTSSFRMGQLLRFRLGVETQHEDVDDFEFMATVFVDAVRSCFREYGMLKMESNVESGGTFLVGYKGAIYTVYDDFQIGVSAHGFDSVGCGSSYALGSLASTKKLSPRDRVQKALAVAEQFSIGVRGPFLIEELTP